MLVLSRKVNESIILTLPTGEEISVTITSLYSPFQKEAIQIGIEAPLNIKVSRKP
jgi:carbon storage regulator CsrA